MKAFGGYVRRLHELLSTTAPLAPKQLAMALDGQPARELRRSIAIGTLRANGAFFSGVRLSRRLVRALQRTVDSRSVLADSSCGTGDLLVAASALLPVRASLSKTLDRWGRQLAGLDRHPEFIAAATARLALAAVQRGATIDCSITDVENRFPALRSGSALEDTLIYEAATHLLMNPPFTPMEAPEGCKWGRGQVNSAAVFLHRAVLTSKPGTRVAAILPDVLRSGSRYQKWRVELRRHLSVERIQVIGRFAPEVDVDVFLLVGCVTAESVSAARSWAAGGRAQLRVGDLCRVSVGPLVPFRHAAEGPSLPLVAPRGLPQWKTVRSIEARRRFAGASIEGPFVAVRRTSKPGEGSRAIATIIALDEPAAIENHIIVLRPIDGTLKTCRRIMASLGRPETTAWLDQRIRCRHLTVDALGRLPIWE